MLMVFHPFDIGQSHHLSIERQGGQVLPGTLAKSLVLPAHRSPDDLVLLAIGVQQGRRVAISNVDYVAGQGLGLHRKSAEAKKP